jgi:N-acetyl-anhydromuramyl-L-alanine amidase AmpD
MRVGRHSLLIGVTGIALLGSGALLWLARDLLASASSASGRPSLLEILEEVRQGPGAGMVPPRPAPPPPAQAAWRSPLASACRGGGEASLRLKLETLRPELARRRARVEIHPTNYGKRHRRDAFGNRVDPTPRVVVLHETVYGIGSAINTFRTPHPRDEDQVSYHVLIAEDGTVVDLLDPSQRAFGAGFSAFEGKWVVTNAEVKGSINNFALHVSLETPLDGEDADPTHSGYSEAQYDALALLLEEWMQRYPIGPDDITTHRHVDLGLARADPRSFRWDLLGSRLAALGSCGDQISGGAGISRTP